MNEHLLLNISTCLQSVRAVFVTKREAINKPLASTASMCPSLVKKLKTSDPFIILYYVQDIIYIKWFSMIIVLLPQFPNIYHR